MESTTKSASGEDHVTEPAALQFHSTNKKEHHIPRNKTHSTQAVKPDINKAQPEIPTRNKKTVTVSRKSLIICVTALLLLLIGGLTGGLVGGLNSKNTSSSSSSSKASPASSTASTSTIAMTTTTKASTATSTAAPASYPSSYSASNLVQNPGFEKGLLYWSDPQHCWQATDDPNGVEENVTKIARVYDNDQNPGSPCSLSQMILTAGAGSFALAFLWGTYWNNSIDAAKDGGRLVIRAGGSSSPAVILNTTFSVPGRNEGFPVASFVITTYEENFVIDFSGWSGKSVWDIGKVQLTRT